MSPLEKVSRNDAFESAFNQANVNLTLSAHALKRCKVYIVHLQQFIQACHSLAEVLIKFEKKNKLLDFYLWVRSKISRLFLKTTTGLSVKIHCIAQANIIDEQVIGLCQEIYAGKVAPLLQVLTYSPQDPQQTTRNP